MTATNKRIALVLGALASSGFGAFAQEAHGGTEAGESHSAFPPFDPATFGSTLFWLFIVFVTLYWLMSRIALPRVASTIEKRNATITGDLDRAAIMQKKAEDAGAAYAAALAKAKANANSIGQQAKDKASAEAADRRKAVEGDVATRIAAAEEQIAATKAAAMGNVEGIALDAAASIVERLTGIAPSSADVKQAVAQSILR